MATANRTTNDAVMIIASLCTYHFLSLAPIFSSAVPEPFKDAVGMRRHMIPPSDPIASHRFVDYGGRHPFDDQTTSTKARRIKKEEAVAVTSIVQPIRIHLDTTALEQAGAKYRNKIRFLEKYALPLATDFWKSALNVVPVKSGLQIQRSWCPFGLDSNPIFSPEGMSDVDLIIFVTANGDECSQINLDSVLASSFGCYWDQYSRPVAGNIDICFDSMEDITDKDLSYLNSANGLAETVTSDGRCRAPLGNNRTFDATMALELDCEKNKSNSSNSPEIVNATEHVQSRLKSTVETLIHELTHTMGMSFQDMLYYRDWSTGLLWTPSPKVEPVMCTGSTGTVQNIQMPSDKVLKSVSRKAGDIYYEVVTPTVLQVVRNQFDCQSLTGAALEDQPSNSQNCIEAHWEERYFATEIMSPVDNGIPQTITPLTLALLKDTGWYWPKFDVTMVSPFGLGAGCSFVTEDCIKGGKVPSYGMDAFCSIERDEIDSFNVTGTGCDPTHTHVSQCDLIDYSMPIGADLAPPPVNFRYFSNPSLGSITSQGNFCPMFSELYVDCTDPTNKFNSNLPSVNFLSESFGPNSKCFLSDDKRPVCLNAQCDKERKVIEVTIGSFVILCSESGESHVLPETTHNFICPSFASICPDLVCPGNCAGNGVCNRSKAKPGCECFDSSDKSVGCTESNPLISISSSNTISLSWGAKTLSLVVILFMTNR